MSTSLNSDLPLGASLLVWREDGKFLAVTRRHSEELCLPGGKREKGESAIYNAIRETAEETGVWVPKALMTPLYSAPCDPDPLNQQTFFVDTFIAPFNHTMGYPANMEEGIRVVWIEEDEFMRRTPFKIYNQAVLDAWKSHT